MSLVLSQAMSFGESSLYELIFKTILQLPRCTGNSTWGCVNGALPHDFVYALFIPHIVLLIFFFIATKGIGHKGLEALLGVGVYIFIIYSGWYAFFANLALMWLVVSLFIGGFYFFWGRIIHPTRSKQLFKLGYDRAKKSGDKRKEIQALQSDIAYLEKEINKAKNRGRKREVESLAKDLTQKKLRLRELKR